MATFKNLYEAVMAHNFAQVQRLVSRGIDVNCRDSKRRTVLHHAVLHLGDVVSDIKNLIKLGADINAVDMNGKTPLHYVLSQEAVDYIVQSTYDMLAKKMPFKKELWDKISRVSVYNQLAEAVRYLVGLGANINAKCDCHVTSIHRAIRLKNVHGLQILVRLGVEVNAQKLTKCTAIQLAILLVPIQIKLLKCLAELGADCNSPCSVSHPLDEAVELGRLDLIKILVENGANINTQIKYNYTPIMPALDKESVDTIECLAKLGADINCKMSITTVVHETVKTGRVDIMEYLVKKGANTSGLMRAGVTALGMAVARDLRELMNILLKVGADVNVRYDLGIPPLVVAIRLKDTEMVKALVRLGAKIDEEQILENTTVLYQARGGDPQVVKLFIQHGGDVNLRYNRAVLPIHDVVARGDCQMLRVLAKLGANMNSSKVEGLGLLDVLLEDVDQDNMAMTEVLVEAGFDLNKGHNRNVTALHDAVRLGDREMVQTLGDLKADMNSSKTEGNASLVMASMADKTDAIRYLVQKGANINMELTTGVTPLHDAVRERNIEMAHVLLRSGANAKSVKHKVRTLNHAILYGNKDTVKCLLDCHADVNKKTSTNISPLHDAVENSDLAMVSALTNFGYERTKNKVDDVMAIDDSIVHDRLEITETLLKHGADTNCLQNINTTPLDAALKQNDRLCASLLVSRGEKAKRDSVGSSPLHTACDLGHIDHARLLIIAGCDVNKCNCYGSKPLDLMPLAKVIDYHVLLETTTAEKITEQVPTSFVCVSDCMDMKKSLNTPGIGDVRYITSPSSTEISIRVNQLLETTTRKSKAFSGRTLKPIGSAAEGTKVGLPNEMDFLFEVPLSKDEESEIAEFGYGYMKYNYVMESLIRLMSTLQKNSKSPSGRLSSILRRGHGSAGFHTYFKEEVMNDIFVHLPDSVSDDKVSIRPKGSIHVKDSDRKANSTLLLMWDDGNTNFHISVDIVPSLHIDNWPEGAITSTWLMDKQQLRSRGHVLVPKPPHVKSDLAKRCTAYELRTLWKISFPHLETEHMQELEQRVKDVYLTAKCLRNPDVCRIMVTDNGSFPRNVDKYVTSYLLKMCFFKNVEHFRQQDMCLEEMVCKVYDELEQGLSKAFIPLFFLPNVSALDGIKLDVAKSAKVAKIMAQFARALYQCTCQRADGGITDQDDATVHPRSVYRVYNISEEE